MHFSGRPWSPNVLEPDILIKAKSQEGRLGTWEHSVELEKLEIFGALKVAFCCIVIVVVLRETVVTLWPFAE